MRVPLILAVVLCAGASYGFSVSNRIVGGSPAEIENYPSLCQVESMGAFTQIWGQSCAASILTTRYVLSAAHCFEGIFYIPSRRRIRAGTTYRQSGGQVVYVEREFNHPAYGRNGMDSDISVVRLAGQLVFNPVIQQGTITAPGSDLPDHTPVVHAGWGRVAFGGDASPVLRDVTIFTINRELCRYRYSQLRPFPGIVTDNMICAGILNEGGKDACQGDSGGPMYYGDIIVGVVSWGEGCANDTFPGVSTAVAPFTEWIIATAL